MKATALLIAVAEDPHAPPLQLLARWCSAKEMASSPALGAGLIRSLINLNQLNSLSINE
jgi:hypothetical protein